MHWAGFAALGSPAGDARRSADREAAGRMGLEALMKLFIFLAVAAPLQASPTTPLEQGRELTVLFYKGELEAVWSSFSEETRHALGSANNLRAFRAQVEDQVGTEQAVVEEKVEARNGHQVYLRIARFSKVAVPIMVQWAFGPDGTVQSFFIRPVPQEAPSERLDYATKAELRLPFAGPWFVFWGGRSLAQNYHASTVHQRFAYDLVVKRDGRTHTGEGKRNEDYYCFDQKIVAPAPGTVVSVENGVEDNVPPIMNPLVPMGNHVILDHGNGEFSFLCHFRQGTVAVKKGDPVKGGDLLGRCGNSGNSSEPHLHYHLQDSADFGQGRGLPAAFRAYLADGKLEERGEPVKGQTIEAP